MEKGTKLIISLIAFLLIILYFGPLTVLKAIVGLFLMFIGGYLIVKAPSTDMKTSPSQPPSFTFWTIIFGLIIVLLGVYLIFY